MISKKMKKEFIIVTLFISIFINCNQLDKNTNYKKDVLKTLNSFKNKYKLHNNTFEFNIKNKTINFMMKVDTPGFTDIRMNNLILVQMFNYVYENKLIFEKNNFDTVFLQFCYKWDTIGISYFDYSYDYFIENYKYIKTDSTQKEFDKIAKYTILNLDYQTYNKYNILIKILKDLKTENFNNYNDFIDLLFAYCNRTKTSKEDLEMLSHFSNYPKFDVDNTFIELILESNIEL
jgi:hypothetical protein